MKNGFPFPDVAKIALVSMLAVSCAESATALAWNVSSLIGSQSMACCADDVTFFVSSGDGFYNIYKTTNSAATWNEILRGPGVSLASSGNGADVAVPNDDLILSTNGGGNFATNSSVLCSVAAWSADGTELAIAGRGLLLTLDHGLSWNAPSSMQSNDWGFLALSVSGTVILAAPPLDQTGRLAISTNRGAGWATASATNRLWSALACNGDGSRIAAGVQDVLSGLLVSRDGGRTWSYPAPVGLPHSNGNYYGYFALAMSADGGLLAASIDINGSQHIYISRDLGNSWTFDDPPSFHGALACSPDGTVLLSSSGGFFAYEYLAPPLSIAASGSQLTLSWPSPSSQYTLQQISNLASTNWLPVTNALTVTNYRNQVTLPAPAGGNVFYRLSGPGS